MDSHSRSASPREAARPQHRPPSPPSPGAPAAFDNRAYSHDEADPNHNDSFTSNAPHQNGHSKEPNGDTKTLEAVNLELINLTPKNGNGKKKDVEVDMNATNPYDEYFVPVNEHRKYMRGEKLYVTSDKRGKKGGCKRPLCWTLLGLVVAAIVALIVLAATGILFTNSPTTLEQYNSSISSARALGGIGSAEDEHDHTGHTHDHSGHAHDHSNHDHSGNDQESIRPEDDNAVQEPKKPLDDTQNDEAVHQPTGNLETDMGSDEVADASMYVPRTLEGELKIDNEDFKPELEDPESAEYRDFVSTFSEALKRALFDRNTLDQGDQDITLEVVGLRKGSLIVTYRIHWNPKTKAQTNEDLLTTKSLQTSLNQYLSRNSRMISTYHIAEETMPTSRVLDVCKVGKNDCQYDCEFDENTLEFVCTCPRGQMIDMSNPKKCMHILENTDQIEPDVIAKQKEFRVINLDSNPTTRTSKPEEEKPETSSVHVSSEPDHIFDWTDTQKATTTTTESEPDLNQSHIFGYTNEKSEKDSSEEPQSVPEPGAEPEPTAEAEPAPAPEPAAEPNPISEPEPAAEPNTISEPEPTAEPNPISEPEPNAEPNPTSEPEPNAEPNPISELEPTTKRQSEAEPEPTVEPEPSAEPKPSAEPEPSAEPKSAESESSATPEPSAEPKALVDQEPTSEAKPSEDAEPAAEPNPSDELEPISEQNTKVEESDRTHEEGRKTIAITHTSYHNNFYPSYFEEDEHPSIASTPESTTNEQPTTESDWLESSKVVPEINAPMESFHLTQQRSFGNSENDVTTETSNENHTNNEVSFNQINDIQSSEESTATSSEGEISTEKTITEKPESALKDITTTSAVDTSTTEPSLLLISPLPKNDSSHQENRPEHAGSIHLMINEARSLGDIASVSTAPTTIIPETTTEYSINKQVTSSQIDKDLIKALNKDNQLEKTETTTEKLQEDDATPITFDEISAHYNRSSKSIDNENTTTETMSLLNETAILTTETEWLTENITEVPYEEAMNKMEKHEFTDTPATKIEELQGDAKYDYEPDYLSGIGTTSKSSDSDVPLYGGMAHDYDGEGLQENIRVNKNVEETVKPLSSEVAIDLSKKELLPKTTPSADMETTTTVSAYIYKASGQLNNESSPENIFVSSENSSTVVKTDPAPVWEVSEDNKGLNVAGISRKEISTTGNNSDEMAVTVSTVSASPTPHLNQSSTGFKVNVYEIPSHNANSSFNLAKTSTQSAESELEHETDMNPFLPIEENNNTLVKILQGGHDHDLEPVNLNETHNENGEEHTLHASDSQESPINDSTTVAIVADADESTFKSTTQSSTPASETSNNQALQKESTENVLVDSTSTVNNSEKVLLTEKNEPETSPVSTFLQDTDDLDVEKQHTTEIVNEPIVTVNPFSSIPSTMPTESNMLSDEAFLRVLPAPEKRTKEELRGYESENSQTFNDISDSPKKKTFQTAIINKLSNVLNNEA